MEGEDRYVGDREWGAGIRRGGEIEVSFSVLYLGATRRIVLVCQYEAFELSTSDHMA